MGWYGGTDYVGLTQTGTIGTYWKNLTEPDDSFLFQTARITSSEGGMSPDIHYRLPLLDGWYFVGVLTGEHPYGGAEFTIFFERNKTGETVVQQIRPKAMVGFYTPMMIGRVVQVTNGALMIETTTQVTGINF